MAIGRRCIVFFSSSQVRNPYLLLSLYHWQSTLWIKCLIACQCYYLTLQYSGINIRYLGVVTKTVEKYKTLCYLKVFFLFVLFRNLNCIPVCSTFTVWFQSICISELICRAAKHLFKIYIQDVNMTCMSQSVAHFLNCLIGSVAQPHSDTIVDEVCILRDNYTNSPNLITSLYLNSLFSYRVKKHVKKTRRKPKEIQLVIRIYNSLSYLILLL